MGRSILKSGEGLKRLTRKNQGKTGSWGEKNRKKTGEKSRKEEPSQPRKKWGNDKNEAKNQRDDT